MQRLTYDVCTCPQPPYFFGDFLPKSCYSWPPSGFSDVNKEVCPPVTTIRVDFGEVFPFTPVETSKSAVKTPPKSAVKTPPGQNIAVKTCRPPSKYQVILMGGWRIVVSAVQIRNLL